MLTVPFSSFLICLRLYTVFSDGFLCRAEMRLFVQTPFI
uniref:Zeaxanthin epoxidaseic-like n=1 Tax=Rhizophora mucronata TaxID=61149 RepID=A0A2P2MN48_RHIMU